MSSENKNEKIFALDRLVLPIIVPFEANTEAEINRPVSTRSEWRLNALRVMIDASLNDLTSLRRDLHSL